jgi:ATP/maltotriose-dependent transcriptional regulator MalT
MAADHLMGVTDEFAGDVRQASDTLERAAAAHDPARGAEYRRMFGVDPGMQARSMSSRSIWALGFPDRALQRAKETVIIAEGQQQPLVFIFANLVLQGVHLYRGEADEAIRLGDKILAWCEEYSFPQEHAWSRGFQGAAYALAGERDRGADQIKGALDSLTELRTGFVRTMFQSLHAEALSRADRIDEGLAAVDGGFAHAERTGEHGFIHELHRIRGELRMKQGRLDDAEQSLREALAYARLREAKSFELRAAMGLARLLRDTNRRDDARLVLQPVVAWFTEGWGTADLTAARKLLTGLEQ